MKAEHETYLKEAECEKKSIVESMELKMKTLVEDHKI